MALYCPRCPKTKLDEIDVGDVLLDRCPSCAGLWFDHDEISGIVGRREGLKRLESFAPGVDYQIVAMNCPRCVQVTLRKANFKEPGGKSLTLFRCVSCFGTWIDRGELREAEDPLLPQTLKHCLSLVFP